MTKNSSLLLFAALLCAPGLCRAEVTKDNMTKEQAEGIARLVSEPVKDVVLPAMMQAVTDALQSSTAANWALWDLLDGMAALQKAGKPPLPTPRWSRLTSA